MKKIWTVFTATILLCCALFAVSVNAETEEAAVTQLLHSHPVCGARCSCGTFHTDVNWEPLSADATTLSGGHYYLENDVTANDITVTGEVSICLNGNKLTEETSGSCIFVKGSGTLTICDCIGTGVISNTYDIGGSAGCVYLSGASSMTVYGGTIIGGAFDAVACGTTGNLSVCGGTLTGNSDGIGIHEVHDLTISGGTITGTNGDGISCDYGSFQNITISGGQIEGKYSGIQFGEFACSGQVLIQNGTIRSTGSVPNATTFAADYYGLSFKNSNGGTCYLTISGGTFSGERGGFYNHNPNLKATVSDGTLLKSSDYFSAGIYTDAGKFQINGGKIYGITCEGAVNVTVSNGELLYILLSGSDSGSSYLQINGGTIGRVGSQTYAYAINNPMMNPTWRDSVQIYGGTIEGTKYAVRSVSPMDLRIFGGTLSGSNADIYMASTTVSPSEAYISLSGYTGDPLTAETSSSSEIGTYIARNVASDELITLVNDNRSALYDAKHSAVIVTGPHTHSYSNYIPNGNSETAACDYNCGTTDTRIRNAATPVISAQPASETYRIGETANALTVTAGVSDNGTITYQWYENTTASNIGGTAISGAVSANYTPDISAIGTTYYYVIITNTNLSATNKQTVSAVSDVVSVTVNSEALPSGTCGDNLTWTLMSDGTLTISGTGPMWDWEEVSLTPWFDYRSDIVSIVLENGVTSIGNSAFVYLPNLTSVSLPEGLVRLGDSCFCNSDSLQTIHFPSTLSEIGAQAFSGAGLTEICLPAGITVVEDSAFFGCPELEKVTFLGNVTEIKSSAFGFCSKLKEIALPETVQSIGQSAFFQTAISSVYIPASVQSIEQVAFGGCSQLTSITAAEENAFYTSDAHGVLFTEDMSTLVQYPVGNTATEYSIPSGVKTIGYCAFESCKHLQKVTVPEGVTMLSQAAFGYCSNLSEVILPSSVEIIDGLAFESCVSLTEVTIPQGVVQLRTGAFRDCTALSKITIPASVTRMDKILFSNCPNVTIHGYTGSTAEAYAAENSIPFEALDVPEHIFTYTLRAYNGEKAAEITGYSGPGGAIDIPATYTHTDGKTYPVVGIGRNAFTDITAITSVSFPDGLIWIDLEAFRGTSITEAVIPSSVQYIGKSAFPVNPEFTTLTLRSRETIIDEYYSSAPRIVYEDGTVLKNHGDFVYYLRGNEAIIVSYTGTGTAVTIPSSVTDGAAVFSVTEIGREAFANNTSLLSVTIPGTVTKIREMAFYKCQSLASVNFPSSLTHIGICAFRYCSALTEAVLPDGLTELQGGAFGQCASLRYVRIPASLSEPSRCFYPLSGRQIIFQECPLLVTAGPIGSGCNLEFGWTDTLRSYLLNRIPNLSTITLPDGMTSIERQAVWGCEALTKIVIPASVTQMGSRAIFECPNVTIHGYTGSAAETYAAENSIPFVFLGSVEIPDTPDTPVGGEFTFEIKNYNGIVGASLAGYSGPGGAIEIPATYTHTDGKTYPVQRIEWRLFQYNTSITSVTFPEGLICIDLFSFKGTSLTEVTIPASVEHIGIEAFADCTSLKTAYLESRDTTFDGSVFPAGCEIVYTDGADIKTSGDFTYYVRGTEAVIHSYTGSGGAVIIPVTVTDGGNTYTVTEIGRRAFADNTSVTAVAIPTTVTYIREQAFYRCTSLAAVSIPAGVTELGKQAFFGCTALTSVVLPDGLTKISGGTFLNCPSLAYLQLPASLSSFGRAHPMSSLSQYEFGGCPLLVTAGPIGSGCNLEFGWTDTLPPMIFDIMDKLTTVTLPEGMTSISRNAFRRCGALTKIVIPASVTDIQKDAVSECPGVTIYGYTGSAAETYAEENSIPFVALSDSLLYGDVNGDTVINGKDLTLIRRFISGGFTLNNFSEEAADVNLDGVINGKDLTLIRRYISGGFDVTLGK